METLKRTVFVTPLVVLSVVTSITIVMDASEWYGNLYQNLELFGWTFTGKFRGITFALILEVFLAVMMATRVLCKPKASSMLGPSDHARTVAGIR